MLYRKAFLLRPKAAFFRVCNYAAFPLVKNLKMKATNPCSAYIATDATKIEINVLTLSEKKTNHYKMELKIILPL